MGEYPFIPVSAWIDQSHIFEAGGHNLACWVHENPNKDRPWLLLIHGFPTSSWDWSPLWPTLSQYFNLAAIDMLGFGFSDKPRNIDYSIIQQTDFHEALIGALGIAETHILAHDYGVSIAQELLARHNEQSLIFDLKSICFLNGGLFPAQHRALPIQQMMLGPFGSFIGMLMNKKKFRHNFSAVFAPKTRPSTHDIDGYWHFLQHNKGNRILHKLMQYIPERLEKKDRWENALIEAHAPLRLINGGLDPISGKHLYDHFIQTIPHADAHLLDDVGHYPHNEAPGQVLELLIDFHGFNTLQETE